MDNPVTENKYSEVVFKTVTNRICFMAHWELTYGCNLHCRHCYVCRNESKKEFTLEKAKSILDELKNAGCLFLVLSGGEIFTRKDFFDIAAYARSQDFALRLMTNGTLLQEEDCERIAAFFPLTVEMSIYAATGRLHDAVTRVNGSFDTMLRAIKMLERYNVRVLLKFIMMNDTVQYFSEVRALAEGLGCDFIFDFAVAQKDDGSAEPLKYRISKLQLKEFFSKNNIPLDKAQDYSTLMCRAGLNNLLITPYLDVYPCVGLKIKLGNLHEQSLAEIWSGAEGLKMLRGIRDSDLPRCRECKLMPSCYRCPGLAYTEGKDLFGPSKFDCMVAETVDEIIAERQVHVL